MHNPLPARRRPLSLLRGILVSEAGGGLVLMAAALTALVVANSPMSPAYTGALAAHVGGLSVLEWVNDALMAIFFLLVGLEIKREVLDGQLATWPRRILPGVAALGGMVVPALFYLALNAGSPATLRGWAIPSATDIAFSLGVLALLGSRAPVSLKIFLTALAIIDDLGAVIIIAVFYTSQLNTLALFGAVFVLSILRGLNAFGYLRLSPYVVLGVLLWLLILKSGIHATLAGVALALTIPLKASPGHPDDVASPLHVLEHAIQPWVAFLIIPIFGFANAGISFAGMNLTTMLAPVTLGVAAGLFFGKQLGVFLTTRYAVWLGFAERPEHASWLQVYGVSLLCGIGFTMSLFIGLLAFPGAPALQDQVKVGVLLGSILAGLVGTLVLVLAPSPVRLR